MRFEGVLSEWNDARGFGFITPSNGGEALFAHISAFPRMAQRPAIGLRVSFEVETGPNKKKRATQIRLLALTEPETGKRPVNLQAQHRNRRHRMPVLLLLFGVVLAAWAYQRYSVHATAMSDQGFSSYQPPTPQATARNTSGLEPSKPAYRCDGRSHCSQMKSCEEAKFFLNHCPTVQMDGDNDGVPCEQQWCNGLFGN